MRLSLITTVSALALLAAPVLAQTSSPPPSNSPGNGSPSSTQHAPAPDPTKQEDVSQIKGSAVYGSDSKKIGSISTVLMKPGSKQIDRFVVGAGGVLGMGAHDVALPADQFKWDADRDGFVIAKTGDELKSMPAWAAPGSAATRTDSGSAGSSTPPARPATAPATTR